MKTLSHDISSLEHLIKFYLSLIEILYDIITNIL